MIQNLNTEIFVFLNSFSQYNLIEQWVCIFADLPIFFIPLFLVIAWIFYSYKKDVEQKKVLLFIFYSTIIALLINLIIQHIIILDRPENYIKWAGKLLLKHIPDASFPSDHTSIWFSFLFSLFFGKFKKIWYYFLPFIILMGLSRVIAWVHWPFDIIAGIGVWFFSSFFTFSYLKKQKLVKSFNECIIKIWNFIKL